MIGTLPKEVLDSLLETLPVEFSIIDEEDNVLAWNRHESRVFKRPKGVVGRNVRDCHPEKSLSKVEAILEEMKAGKRDMAEFWIDLRLEENSEPEKILIQYFALRNPKGKYLGCLECSQRIQHIQSLKGEKRLLD
jgi:PAS domain S-box-containing protein